MGYTEAWCDEYVADCIENGTVYCAGGNNGGTGNYKTNYCAGERKLYATPRLYLRPNYKVNPKLTWAKVTLNQNVYNRIKYNI